VPSFREQLRGKSILLTGVTGFLAKVFLEKILRVCPEVKSVYLLIRASDGDHQAERAECDVFSSDLFDGMKENFGRGFADLVRDKVQFVRGDTGQNRMGLPDKDYVFLSQEIDYVVNSAASTDFMNRLDRAVETNALSVQNLVKFIQGSSRARLLHISTCYVNENLRGSVDETFYEQPAAASVRLPYRADGRVDFEKVLVELSETVREAYETHPEGRAREEALVKAGWDFARARGWNNVYTFTKWLGENALRDARGKIHASILRPSIVESCLSEPAPGWIEGWKVGDPLIYAIGTRKIGFFPSRPGTVIDFIPVDIVSNAMFVALNDLARRETPDLKAFHVCSGEENPLRVKVISGMIRRGFGVDRQGSEPFIMPPLMWRMLERGAKFSGAGKFWFKKWSKFSALANIYSPYTSLRCVYRNAELRGLHARMSAADRALFPVSAAHFAWEDYLGKIHIPGLKKHVLRSAA
jgi:nucleoside-diphosphate-sugar epimerase